MKIVILGLLFCHSCRLFSREANKTRFALAGILFIIPGRAWVQRLNLNYIANAAAAYLVCSLATGRVKNSNLRACWGRPKATLLRAIRPKLKINGKQIEMFRDGGPKGLCCIFSVCITDFWLEKLMEDLKWFQSFRSYKVSNCRNAFWSLRWTEINHSYWHEELLSENIFGILLHYSSCWWQIIK